MRSKINSMTSKELLKSIGVVDSSANILADEPLEDLDGDLSNALRERYQQFSHHYHFSSGDLVTWKPGLMNRLLPNYGYPAVVLEVLDTPVFDTEKDSGTNYFREPLDLILGLFVETGPNRGDFFAYHFDSRRFQPYTKETLS